MPNNIRSQLEHAFTLRRDGLLAEAGAEFQQAADSSREADKREYLLTSLKGLAQVERDANRLDTALTRYREAVSVARELGDALPLAHTLRHLADVYRETDRPDRALPIYEEALGLYRSEPDRSVLDLANCLRPMALLMEQLQRSPEAAAYWREALSHYEAAGIDAGVQECRTAIGRCDQAPE